MQPGPQRRGQRQAHCPAHPPPFWSSGSQAWVHQIPERLVKYRLLGSLTKWDSGVEPESAFLTRSQVTLVSGFRDHTSRLTALDVDRQIRENRPQQVAGALCCVDTLQTHQADFGSPWGGGNKAQIMPQEASSPVEEAPFKQPSRLWEVFSVVVGHTVLWAPPGFGLGEM